MGDDGIDYNIVFPEALISEKHWRGSKEPVVILLGWAGCRDKHLAKYSSIYNQQGCVTVRCTAPLKTIFISESFGYKELQSTAHKLLELLYDYEVENNPVFFHVFSNGGFMLYRYIVELLHCHKQFSTLCIVGTVVDSAPGSQNVIGALRALKTTLRSKVNVLLQYLLLALFAVMVVLLRIVLYPVTKYFHKNHYDAMMEHPAPWPQMYLYSRADRVIRYKDVEKMVKALWEKGLTVESFDFITPAHVSLYRDCPEDYSNRCRTFLTRCMTASVETLAKRRLHVHQ
ncbi:transmembrane protein 53-like [Myxocyprinus asiaticus]|uniref:transmembrane protein 53-like n=1 Tax=Myxocyprinus asiaticus TaxID=70543 RepID=UPI002223C8C0|nr:transmembrane protein 53-like [Myxocyprinus asiaticus]